MTCDCPVIAIDGPAASGKGTLARRLSNGLGFHYLDSGLLYRTVAFCVKQRQIANSEQQDVSHFVKDNLLLRIDGHVIKSAVQSTCEVDLFKNEEHEDCVSIDSRPVDLQLELRSAEVSQATSVIAAYADVREQLIPIQRSYQRRPGLVADGRDMGTVVFPDAELKLYLEASIQARAKRRTLQFKEAGIATSQSITTFIEARDERDMNRQQAPLKRADDAHFIDSTELTIDEMVEHAMGIVCETLNVKTVTT